MLHYSNARSIEKSRRYLVIKGGLAWLLWQERGVVRRGGRNNKYQANRCISMHDMTSSGARGALTRYEVVPAKGGNIRENIPSVLRFRTDEPEGQSCTFAMLGMCDG